MSLLNTAAIPATTKIKAPSSTGGFRGSSTSRRVTQS